MSFTQSRVRLALVSAGLVTLAACGGGGGGGDIPPAASTSVTVSPSLGKFTAGAKVTIKKLDGTVIGSGLTRADGTAVINIGTYNGPMLIEVTGGTGVQFYDEHDGQMRNFGSTDTLTAIAPTVTTALGVTPATHAAVVAIKAQKGSITASVTTDDIHLANTRVATALGITDVLQTPTLVDGSTGSTLDIADAKAKYALQLAALSHLAGSGKTAWDVAKDLASDLSDNKLDGKYTPSTGTVVANSATSYDESSIKSMLETELKTAATSYGTPDTRNVVNSDPTTVGTVTTDVSTIVAPPAGTDAGDIQKAKSFFAELRTNLSAYVNAGKVGYLDTKAKAAGDDIQATATTNMDALGGRLNELKMAIDTFIVAKNPSAYPDFTLASETGPFSAGTVYSHQNGQLRDIYYGRSFTQCWTDSTSAITKASCLHASANSYVVADNIVKMVQIDITPVAGQTNTFTYTAKRVNGTVKSFDVNGAPNDLNVPFANAKNNLLTTASTTVLVPSGTGTVSYTKDGAGRISSLNLDGTFPPSSSTCMAPNADSAKQQSSSCPVGQIEVPATTGDAVKTVGTSSTPSTNIQRWTLSGSVSAKKFPLEDRTMALSVDTSTVDIDTTANVAVNLNFQGSVQTKLTKFSGSLIANNMGWDKSGTSRAPASAVLNGSIADISTGTAVDVLTGKLEMNADNWSNVDATQATSAANYTTGKVTFTGTIKNPSRPDMKLVLSATATGFEQGSATMNFSYGAISITGSRASLGATFKATNQDGIVIAPDTTGVNDVLISKNDKKLAVIKNGIIRYVDGVTESLR